MHAARLFKHTQTDKCNEATERQLRRIDVDMEESYVKMNFSLYGEEGSEMVEGVANFKYMGRTLDQM